MYNYIKEKLSQYKKVGVLGLGVTGRGVYNFFHSNKIELICWDESMKVRQDFLSFRNEAKTSHFEQWQDCSHIVVSPGVSLYSPDTHPIVDFAKSYGIEITSDIEILYNLIEGRAKIIGVTGTNGKSTTTSLITHILKASGVNVSECGNIGISALCVPLDNDVYVIELSSYQLESIKGLRANIAVFLNLTPDHLERHGNIENYTKAKTRIFNNQLEEDWAVIGIDNPITAWVFEEQKNKCARAIGISYNAGFNQLNDVVTFEDNVLQDRVWGDTLVIEDNIYLPAKHNRENICAAYAAARACGVEVDSIVTNLKTFRGLPHRMEFIGTIDDISFYNDSKSTNADSARPALESLSNTYWIVGGIPKAGGIHSLRDCLSNVRKIYIFGAAVKDFARTLESVADYEIHKDLDSAFRSAFKDAINSSGSGSQAILLSPACASFDQYSNFEERGRHFVELFHEHKKLEKL
ncbi:MAG: UDP-N-acetylmuramoyl-L-alanine--D-glutamate ligase [Alphaproteobacteria bacterium]|nr:UDP-N-acetylmuramoyl-L-alanine--D-glutamate ligase [Alphaproteobacteria bacterium]